MSGAELLSVRDLRKHFAVKGGVFSREIDRVHAVDGVSFDIGAGETLGLVGESGCGKSTTGRLVLRLMDPTAGSVRIKGEEIANLDKNALRRLRRHMQIIFQDPYASLNPHMTVGEILAEPMAVHGLHSAAERESRVRELLDVVGLLPEQARRYPHQFSGGQRQRIGIARALYKNASVLVFDEATSALDTRTEQEIQRSLEEVSRGRTTVVIAHRLSTIVNADEIVVLDRGSVVERGTYEELKALGGRFSELVATEANDV